MGQAAVFAIVAASATGAIPISVSILTVPASVLPIVYVVSLFVGTGRIPSDRHAGTIAIGRLAFRCARFAGVQYPGAER